MMQTVKLMMEDLWNSDCQCTSSYKYHQGKQMIELLPGSIFFAFLLYHGYGLHAWALGRDSVEVRTSSLYYSLHNEYYPAVVRHRIVGWK
jgi:hypothetical protein